MKLMKKDIKPNEVITTFFALESMQLKKSINQRQFLVLSLHDKTGKINGYIWEGPVEIAATLNEKTIVKVRGTATMYKDSLIINVEQIRAANKYETEIGDFLNVVPGGITYWHERFIKIVRTIQNSDCRRLINRFLEDNEFMERFINAPGGLSVHHNYVGGLMEHTTSAMELVSYFSDRHMALIDKDMAVTGAFLHDIGKTRELYFDIAREYTTEGKLIGHITIGILMLEEKLSGLNDFSQELAIRLRHLIISHHGSFQYGSPVKPATPEALALHLVESADAKLNHMYCHLDNSDPDKDWSSYDKILETEIYQKKYINNVHEITAEAA